MTITSFPDSPPVQLKGKRQRIIATVVLVGMALLGNLLHLPLFFSVDFIFGSVAVMLAASLLGWLPALLVAVAGGVYTMVLWGHPYALVIFASEAVFVSLLYRRLGGLLFADLAFWLLLGAPMVLLFYRGMMGLTADAAGLIALKQPLNGIFNALLASLMLVGMPFLRDRMAAQFLPAETLRHLMFNIVLVVLLVGVTLPLIYFGQHYRSLEEQELAQNLRYQAGKIVDFAEQNPDKTAKELATLLDAGWLIAPSQNVALTTGDGTVSVRGWVQTSDERGEGSEQVHYGAVRWLPEGDMPKMKRWQLARYRVDLPVSHPDISSLVVEEPGVALVAKIRGESARLFALMVALALASILAARQVSIYLLTPVTRLSRVASDVSNGVVITDPQGRVLWVNHGFTRMTGYELDDLRGKKPGHVLQGPKTDSRTVERVRQALSEGQGFEADLLNYSKSGVPYWVQIYTTPMLDQAGEIEGFIAIESDITAVKEVELRLQQFKNTLDCTIDCVFIFDAETLLFTYVNRGAVEQVGYSEAEMLTMHPYDIKPYVSKEDFDDLVAPLLRGETTHINFDTVHQHKDGTRIPVQIALQYVADDGFGITSKPGSGRFVAIVRDASERMTMMDELSDQVARTSAILENMVDGIITISEKGIIDSCNPASEHIFGYSRDEMIGQNVKMLMPNPHRDNHDGYLRNYQTTGKAQIIGIGREVEGLHKNGDLIPIDLAVSEISYRGNPLYVGLLRDITERKRLEKLKSEFVSTVSHELRTPLTSIRGALNLVMGKAGDALSGKPRQMLEMAERNSERLTLLINDILDLEKIESGRMEFALRDIDLVDVVKEALQDNEGYASNNHVSLKLENNLEHAPVHGDPHRLQQVLANLISNAVKYSPEEDVVTVSVTEADGRYRVTVSDNGNGIPENFRSQIFQRFAQADSSDTRQKGGTGLGLSISKAIIERHGGRIDYRTESGVGTSFYFDLFPQEARALPSNPEMQSTARALVCEDDPDVVMVLSEVLSDEGVAADVAYSVRDAHALLSEHSYDLILLDLTLPDGDGMSVVERLREHPDTEQTPVIVVSGRANEARDGLEGRLVQILDWVQKPLDMARLRQAIEQVTKSVERPRILHVENDLDIVEIVRAITEGVADFAYATGLAEARTLLSKTTFDLVILDLGLNDGSGEELLDDIGDQCPVIIFSAQWIGRELGERVTHSLTKSVTSNTELYSVIRKTLKRGGNDG